MAKVCYLVAVLLASLSVTLADPSSSTMYGATPAKYPAPATYPAPAPAPAKYETPTTTAKYEAPAPAKYEAAPMTPTKYEEKKEEYPMKMEYKTEEKPMEYKKEEQPMKPEYKKETYPKKMEYGGKKYRRSIDEDAEESHSDEAKVLSRLSRKEVQAVRDAVIVKLLSESDPGFRKSFGKTFAQEGAGAVGSFIGSKIRGGDPFAALNDPRRGGIGGMNGKPFKPIPSYLLNDEKSWLLGLSKKEAKAVRDAVMTQLLMESDPGFGSALIKTFAKEGAGVVGSFLGSKIRGGDPFTTLNDPRRGGKFAGQLAGSLAGGALGGLLSDENCWRMGLSRKQAKAVRDAVMTQLVMESDPAFRKAFGKTFAQEGAGAVGSFIGSKIRGGDPFSVTVADLVELYGRDPARFPKKFLGKVAGNLGAGVVGGLLGNEEALSMEELDDMMENF